MEAVRQRTVLDYKTTVYAVSEEDGKEEEDEDGSIEGDEEEGDSDEEN